MAFQSQAVTARWHLCLKPFILLLLGLQRLLLLALFSLRSHLLIAFDPCFLVPFLAGAFFAIVFFAGISYPPFHSAVAEDRVI